MIPAVIGNFLFFAVEMIGFQRLVGLMSFSLYFGCWEMEDGRWDMEKRRRLVAVLDTSAKRGGP